VHACMRACVRACACACVRACVCMRANACVHPIAPVLAAVGAVDSQSRPKKHLLVILIVLLFICNIIINHSR
jgi:hypothetical protein